MATKTFNATKPHMPNSIVCMSNGTWDVELYRRNASPDFEEVHGRLFDVRFAREYTSSFGTYDGDVLSMNMDGARVPPKYVQEFARRMWRDNVA